VWSGGWKKLGPRGRQAGIFSRPDRLLAHELRNLLAPLRNGLSKVRTEWTLVTLAYNLNRLFHLGVGFAAA